MIRKLIDSIAFRTTKRYNVLKIRDLPANYWDKDTILLYAVMQLVVDFVEIECAFMELDAPYTLRQTINLWLPWFLRSDEVYRNRELGLKHLEMLERFYGDKANGPSDIPKVIRDVYLWWKDVRPNRPDPGDASGLNKYMKQTQKKDDKKVERLILAADKVEAQYEREDTAMLKKIIDVRNFMWT